MIKIYIRFNIKNQIRIRIRFRTKIKNHYQSIAQTRSWCSPPFCRSPHTGQQTRLRFGCHRSWDCGWCAGSAAWTTRLPVAHGQLRPCWLSCHTTSSSCSADDQFECRLWPCCKQHCICRKLWAPPWCRCTGGCWTCLTCRDGSRPCRIL